MRKWRSRFVAKRLDGLHDEPRPGAPRTITDDEVEAVIVKTLEETPADATHWSTRSMAKATGMSQSRGLADLAGLRAQAPSRRHLQARSDPLFIEKVRDVVGLYINPPEAALVLCVDEKTQVQALDRTAPVLPLRPGLPERHTHDYVRHGTTNLYAALDVASGKVIADMTERHRAVEFRRFLNLINRCVPEDLDVHLVVDNVSTHKTPEIHRWLLRHPRFTSPFHPDLQLVDQHGRALVRRADQQVAAPRDPPIDQGTRGSNHSVDRQWNEDPKPFVWHKSADEILETLAAYFARISDSGH